MECLNDSGIMTTVHSVVYEQSAASLSNSSLTLHSRLPVSAVIYLHLTNMNITIMHGQRVVSALPCLCTLTFIKNQGCSSQHAKSFRNA